LFKSAVFLAISVFEFDDYKRYLGRYLESRAKEERGYKSYFAESIGCQPSYLSQVINGKPEVTLEQAQRANIELKHDKLESRYFILLVEYSRSGSKDLRDFFKEQLSELKQQRFDLKKRLKETDDIPPEAKHRYYSTWFYSAIHIMLAVPEFNSAYKISQRLNLPEEMVADVVHFLEEIGLVEVKNGKYEFTKMRIHLDRNSEFVQRHHINWRSQALQSAEKNMKDDLHFSTVFAVTRDDFERVKEVFVTAIENARGIIKPSDSKEVYAITLDAFKL
jgi:uncharacterized protein (TIGR02147 family)